MASLIECPLCGGLRHETTSACPHCAAVGRPKRSVRRLAVIAALSGATGCLVPTVMYGPPPVCPSPDCTIEMYDASTDAGDGGDAAIVSDDGGEDAGDMDGGDGG